MRALPRRRGWPPLLGRFLSPDTLVPQPDDPQSFNRYSYVRNNPLRYVDPSGHFWRESLALLGGTLIGSFIGLTGETASQAIAEFLAVTAGHKSVQQAIRDFNSVENQADRIGAMAGGATTGLIISIPSVARKSAGPGILAVASVAGGQVEALAGGIAEEHLRHGRQFDLGNAGLRAAKRGLADPFRIAKDAGLGVAAGLASDVMDQLIDKTVGRAFRSEIKQITDFDPVTKRPNITNLGKSNVVKLNPLQQVLVEGLKTGWDLIAETSVRSVP